MVRSGQGNTLRHCSVCGASISSRARSYRKNKDCSLCGHCVRVAYGMCSKQKKGVKTFFDVCVSCRVVDCKVFLVLLVLGTAEEVECLVQA